MIPDLIFPFASPISTRHPFTVYNIVYNLVYLLSNPYSAVKVFSSKQNSAEAGQDQGKEQRNKDVAMVSTENKGNISSGQQTTPASGSRF
jgi:hypothetical protein